MSVQFWPGPQLHIDMKSFRLLFDYGHGRKTPGKRSPDGRLEEWKYVREVGRNVASYFRDTLKMDIDEIVTNDDDVPLADRVAKVNKIVAANPGQQCLLCSVHVNAAGTGKDWMSARGWSIFIAKNASKTSEAFANAFYDAAVELKQKPRLYLPTQKYWTAGYYILRNTKCPAVLTENFFMDNRQDTDFLLSKEGRQLVENIHILGISKYLGLPYSIVSP